jgi:hypothetical protein
MESSVDTFLKKDINKSILVPSCLLLSTLCLINVPFGLFYMSLFIYYNRMKDSHPELFHNFMICSCIFFGYFILLGLSLYFINTVGGVNLHPNSNERPLFYFT